MEEKERPSKRPKFENNGLELLDEADIPEAVGLVRDVESENDNDDVIIVPNPRLSKLLKSLEFDNPGPQMKKRLKSCRLRERQCEPLKLDCGNSVDDLCDCQESSCPGCFFPCSKCSSNKCGPVCRVKREWRYRCEVKLETVPSIACMDAIKDYKS